MGPTLDVALAGGMTLEVRDGGRLVLGNPLGTLTAEVRVEAGGRLILRDGTLTVNQASPVVIERGATLEIDVGAVIELNGSPTALEIHGDLLIRAGAEFTYGGGGYVLFDLPDAAGLPNVTMEPGSIINIEESRFVIQSNTYVKPTEDPTTQVTMWYANGEFGTKSYFDVSYSTLSIEGSRITGGSGVVVNGYPNVIFDSRFSGGDPCILALRKGSSPLSVRTSEFAGGSYGILSEGVPVGVSASTFTGFGTAVQVSDSTAGLAGVQISGSGIGLSTIRGGGGLLDSEIAGCDVGWYAEDLQVDSGVEGGIVRGNILYGIHDNGYGIQIAGASASSLLRFSLEGTSVDDNHDGVSASGPITVAARVQLGDQPLRERVPHRRRRHPRHRQRFRRGDHRQRGEHRVRPRGHAAPQPGRQHSHPVRGREDARRDHRRALRLRLRDPGLPEHRGRRNSPGRDPHQRDGRQRHLHVHRSGNDAGPGCPVPVRPLAA